MKIIKQSLNYTEADFEPLKKLIPADHIHGWMWMQSFEMESGLRLHYYKHGISRHYIFVCDRGNLWREGSDNHVWQIPDGAYAATLKAAYDGVNPATPYDAEYIQKRNAALNAQGYLVIGGRRPEDIVSALTLQHQINS